MTSLPIIRAVCRYAARHSMSVDAAMLMQVSALLGWLDAEDARLERERVATAAGVAARDEHEEERADE